MNHLGKDLEMEAQQKGYCSDRTVGQYMSREEAKP
jgi:hypothetical protein